MFNKISQFFVIAVMFVLLSISATAQTKETQSDQEGWETPSNPFNCEMNLQNFERLRDKISQQDKDSSLIIISHLGDKERQTDLNYKRLYNVREGLNNVFALPKERIITAYGEKAKGLGRIVFYVAGKKFGTLLVKHNEYIYVGCETGIDDKRYYPKIEKSKGN